MVMRDHKWPWVRDNTSAAADLIQRLEAENEHLRKRDVGAETTFGFASFEGGEFELIVRNREGEETTLYGQLRPGQLEIVDRILPTCVYVTGEESMQHDAHVRKYYKVQRCNHIHWTCQKASEPCPECEPG